MDLFNVEVNLKVNRSEEEMSLCALDFVDKITKLEVGKPTIICGDILSLINKHQKEENAKKLMNMLLKNDYDDFENKCITSLEALLKVYARLKQIENKFNQLIHEFHSHFLCLTLAKYFNIKEKLVYYIDIILRCTASIGAINDDETIPGHKTDIYKKFFTHFKNKQLNGVLSYCYKYYSDQKMKSIGLETLMVLLQTVVDTTDVVVEVAQITFDYVNSEYMKSFLHKPPNF